MCLKRKKKKTRERLWEDHMKVGKDFNRYLASSCVYNFIFSLTRIWGTNGLFFGDFMFVLTPHTDERQLYSAYQKILTCKRQREWEEKCDYNENLILLSHLMRETLLQKK